MTKELEVRVNEKIERVEAVGSTVLPPNALRDAIKAHNFFRGTWRCVCVCVYVCMRVYVCKHLFVSSRMSASFYSVPLLIINTF
jgi:hypothetical protein